jgi:hypothetical protein
MAFAAATPLQNLGPFIFGHQAVDLEEEFSCRTLAQLPIQKPHLAPPALELLDQEDLIGILAG